MNWFMRLERAAVALSIYCHYEADNRYIIRRPECWINRVTRHDRGDLTSDIWLIRLPSWGMVYQVNIDEERFSQRYIAWDSVSGRKWSSGIPV
jgi:hypothetical protein